MLEFPEIKIVGVISDTHNLMRFEAVEALRGSVLIVHAGDIGEPNILEELEKIAPVIAVRGNVDQADWCRELPDVRTVDIGKVKILIIHNLNELAMNRIPPNTKVVISGHSHKPLIETKNGILYLNPGSAGRRRFRLPISVAKMEIEGAEVHAEIIELTV